MKLSDINKIWITADTHAFHKNITRGTTDWKIDPSDTNRVRDFDTPEQMTEQMAANFNSAIPDDGILFHLGDWSFGGEQNIQKFREMLNVKEIHLVTGNHDSHIQKGKWDHIFTSRQKYLELSVDNLTFVLFHFRIASWNNINRGWFQLHGHHHWQGDLRSGNGRQMDVGVDGNNLFPYRLIDVVDLLKDRRFHDENDHHC